MLSSSNSWWHQPVHSAKDLVKDELAAWHIIKLHNDLAYFLSDYLEPTPTFIWSHDHSNAKIFFSYKEAREFIEEYGSRVVHWDYLAKWDDDLWTTYRK